MLSSVAFSRLLNRSNLLSHLVVTKSLSTNASMDRMNIKHFNARSDNFMYVVFDRVSKECALVDPYSPNKLIDFVKSNNLKLKYILTTHHHYDHAHGNEKCVSLAKSELGYAPTVCGGSERVQACTKLVTHEECLEPIGDIAVRCLHTPCHTSDHICYYLTCGNEQPVVFTGDTLFIAGCGRFFEGKPEDMYSALIEKLAKLPANTRVYCGHEYTRKNLQFASQVEPNNNEVKSKLQYLTENPNQPSIPSTIGDELLINPFMRVHTPELQKLINNTNPIEVMARLRQQKDNF